MSDEPEKRDAEAPATGGEGAAAAEAPKVAPRDEEPKEGDAEAQERASAPAGGGDAGPGAEAASGAAAPERPARAAEPAPSRAGAPGADATGEVLIAAEGLAKYYGAFTALEGVSFEVRRGQVVAFLGPNGAGKSTTMRILTGILAPDAGEARIAGLSVIHNRIEVARLLGYLPENGPLYEEMTPLELLRFLGEARGLEASQVEGRLVVLTERLGLSSFAGKAIHKLSKGQRQRVGLAQALIHDPEVLILDEPTSGLDPNQIRDVRRIIRSFSQRGADAAAGSGFLSGERGRKAILLSTHILQEVEAVADRVVFIHQGRIVFQGSVDELRALGPDLDAAFAVKTGASDRSWA